MSNRRRPGPNGRSLAVNTTHTPSRSAETFELRFTSLFDEGKALAFPCDAAGHVDLDALSERARINYFVARTTIGRDFQCPAVRPCLVH
jgi:hypothetical protein